MVEDVQELRLELEADPFSDREALGNRRVVERLVRAVQIEDLPYSPRRGVWRKVRWIRRPARDRRQVLRIELVHIAATSGAYVVHADGVLQIGCRDAVEDHSAITVIVEGAVAGRESNGRAGLERQNISDDPAAQYLIGDAIMV